MAWEENPRICLHMQLIAILSRTGVYLACNLSRGSASISSAADNRRANCVFKALSPFNTSLSKELDTPIS